MFIFYIFLDEWLFLKLESDFADIILVKGISSATNMFWLFFPHILCESLSKNKITFQYKACAVNSAMVCRTWVWNDVKHIYHLYNTRLNATRFVDIDLNYISLLCTFLRNTTVKYYNKGDFVYLFAFIPDYYGWRTRNPIVKISSLNLCILSCLYKAFKWTDKLLIICLN